MAQGAPLTTIDLEVVHRRDADNVARLLEFLEAGDARYRGRPAGQVLRPTPEAVTVEGQAVRVVRLEALAELKRGSTGPKGLLSLAILEETLRS